MKTLSTAVKTSKNRLDGVDDIVWLVSVSLSDTRTEYFTNNPTAISVGGADYIPLPFRVDQVEESGETGFSGLVLSVANNDYTIGQIIDQYGGLRERSVNLSPYIGGEVAYTMALQIQQSEFGSESASFQLGPHNFYLRNFPGERVSRRMCRHPYGGTLCGFDKTRTGASQTCDHTLLGPNGCVSKGGEEAAAAVTVLHPDRFGGFPSIGYR